MKIDMPTVRAMVDARIEFAVSLPTIHGGFTTAVKAEDIPRYVEDRMQYAADFFGVSKDTYLEWLDCYGYRRCSAFNAKGKQCGNYIAGGGREIEEWLAVEGDYCPVHGGDDSETARIKLGRRRW